MPCTSTFICSIEIDGNNMKNTLTAVLRTFLPSIQRGQKEHFKANI